MQNDRFEAQIHVLERQLSAVRRVGELLASSIGLDSVFKSIIPQVSILMEADRSSLLLFDSSAQELWSQVLQGADTLVIRLPLGQGIAGWVAQTGERVNIPDAYEDERFNQAFDRESGYRTREVACVPLTSRSGKLLGVLQVLNNKRGGSFDSDDMALLDTIAGQVGHAVENATLAQQILDKNEELAIAQSKAERRSAELDLLYELEQDAAQATNLDSLMKSVLHWSSKRVSCQSAMLILHGSHFQTLYYLQNVQDGQEQVQKNTLQIKNKRLKEISRDKPYQLYSKSELTEIEFLEKYVPDEIKNIGIAGLTHDSTPIGNLVVINAGGDDDENRESTDKLLTLIASQVSRSIATLRGRTERAETDRLASVGRMLAGVAHDLRNPMTAVSGYAQILVSEDEEEERLFFSENIVRNIKEMTAMVNDVLSYSRGDFTLKTSLVELENLATQIREFLEPLCSQRQISLTINSSRDVISADIAKVKRILLNLGKNAVDAQRRGGSVVIDLHSIDGAFNASVTDTGPGLPTEVKENLFQPVNNRKDGDGTGLGLSIVKRFVDDHYGDIQVETSSDGTVFKIDLPRAETVDAPGGIGP